MRFHALALLSTQGGRFYVLLRITHRNDSSPVSVETLVKFTTAAPVEESAGGRGRRTISSIRSLHTLESHLYVSTFSTFLLRYNTRIPIDRTFIINGVADKILCTISKRHIETLPLGFSMLRRYKNKQFL